MAILRSALRLFNQKSAPSLPTPAEVARLVSKPQYAAFDFELEGGALQPWVQDSPDSDAMRRIFAARWGADLELLSLPPETHLGYVFHRTGQEDGEAFEGRVDNLLMILNGRWGNYVFQLLNLFHIAETVGSRRVYIHSRAFIPIPTTGLILNGIEILPLAVHRPAHGVTLAGVFFSPQSFGSLMDGLTPSRRRALAQRYVLPLMPNIQPQRHAVAADDVVIHIRSGDIFEGLEGQGGSSSGGGLYVQPPLSFYIAALGHPRNAGCGVVHIVAENTLNPVISRLVSYLDGIGRPQTLRLGHDLEGDLGVMIAAKRLILANGTIGVAAALMSNAVTDVFAFRNQSTGTPSSIESYLGGLDLELHIALDREGSYIPRGGWLNTVDQRALMESHAVEDLTWVLGG